MFCQRVVDTFHVAGATVNVPVISENRGADLKAGVGTPPLCHPHVRCFAQSGDHGRVERGLWSWLRRNGRRTQEALLGILIPWHRWTGVLRITSDQIDAPALVEPVVEELAC